VIHRARAVVVAALAAAATACAGPPEPPAIRMTQPDDGRAFVHVVNLPASTLADLSSRPRNAEQWASILKVATAADAPAVIGDYRIVDGSLRFTPAFPFDPGRPYAVRYNGAAAGDPSPPLYGTFSLPATTTAPSTSVTGIYPSGDVVPENLLRMYIEFSAPMSQGSGIEHIALQGPDGAVVEGAFLPLAYEFWNRERTRFTLFFDPGRVKRGILPNRQSGRAMKAGERYTLVVGQSWRDENGQPLKQEFRKSMVAGPADMAPLDTARWRLTPPSAAQSPLVVSFGEPLDHGLVLRALSVSRAGKTVEGEARADVGEAQWTFTPREPWTKGRYALVASSILEDAAGNQIGRAFEIDNFETVDKGPDARTVSLPFVVSW
jgi:hypothetical protein